MDCALISGLGPVHLESFDLKGTAMDSNATQAELDEIYMINGENLSPFNLYYNKNKVLRKYDYSPQDLTTVILSQILKRNKIKYKFIPIKNVWEDREYIYKQKTVVCLSTTFMWSNIMVGKAINWIKKNINYSHIIVGGQYASLKQETLMKDFPEISYIIFGDGEYSLPKLMNMLSDKGALITYNIPNLIYRDKIGNISKTFAKDINIEEMMSIRYKGVKECIPYISMIGCIYNCKFCTQSLKSQKWRFKSAENIYNDWCTYRGKNKTRHITVADSTFFIPFYRMRKLLHLLPVLGLTWEANIRADTPLTPDIVKKLEQANCIALSFGFESMNDAVLNYMSKGTKSEQNKKINELFRKSSIDTLMSFIVGFPGESETEFIDTYSYLKNDHYGHFTLYVFEFENTTMPIWKEKNKYGLKIYENSNLDAKWMHDGVNWSHNGMDSREAYVLRKKTISTIRNSDSSAIFYSWQRGYKWPYVPSLSRQENLNLEKLIDKLVFVPIDYPTIDIQRKVVIGLIKQLREKGINVK